MPDLSTQDGQDAVNSVLTDDTALIVVDNLSCLARRGGRENEADSWQTVADWALYQRTQGRSVLFVHHSGKSGAQRGTSKKEDLLDTVIALTRPGDYSPEQGAVFQVEFEKSRHVTGEDVAPFEASLGIDATGRLTWLIRNIEESTYDRVVALAKDGLKQKEIAEELGINKSNISRAWRKAVQNGDIPNEKGADRW